MRDSKEILTQPLSRELSSTDFPSLVSGLAATIAGTATLPELERGSLVGRYVITSLIGRGAMGVVYAAYDPELERKIAIKVLPLGETRLDAAPRLLREAQALAKLTHPHVVTVHDVGSLKETIWIAMEFVDGQTLTKWLKRQRRSWRETIEVFSKAGEGLAAAHDVGLVHRDFKPDNVMVGKDGRVLVMDFGLARNDRITSEEPRSTRGLDIQNADKATTLPGAILGTPRYMAPEQWKAEIAGAEADQFSFCVALWEALYDELPFSGDSLHELAHSVSSGALRTPSTQNRVPRRLRQILTRGLSAEPTHRWPSMRNMLVLLARKDTRRAWILAGFLLIISLPGYLFTASPEIDQCSEGSNALTNVWDASHRESIATSFGRTELSFANYAFSRVIQDLDDYAQRLETQMNRLCRGRTYGVRSDHALELQSVCLERRRSAFSAVVDVFASADATVVGNANQLIARLPSLDSCEDFTTLMEEERVVVPPADPAQAFAVDEQRRRLASAKAEVDAGNFEKALDTATLVVKEAERINYDPLLAEALVLSGSAIQFGGQYIEATELIQRGYAAAEKSGLDSLAAEAAMRLVHLYGSRHLQLSTAMMWSEVAKAKLSRIRDNGKMLARVSLFTGAALLAAGRFKESEPYYIQGLGLAERHRQNDPGFYAIALNEVGNRELESGEIEIAEQAFRRSLDIRQSIYGPDHPHVAVSFHNLALVLYVRRQFANAAEGFRRALAIR